MARPRLEPVVLALAVVAGSGCAINGYAANRSLHYVHDDDGNELLVRTRPPAPSAYEAYLRARLAIERQQFEDARGFIHDALRWHDDDPQLWTVLGEIEWKLGDFAAAEAAIARALALRPGYPEAERLLASIHDQAEL